MNRINQLFQQKKGEILSVYFTAGYPEPDSAPRIIRALSHAGADMIEVGIPFSDPMADGPVIQHSSQQALKNGMTLKHLFDQIRTVKRETGIPLLLMGYLNPVMQYGFERFCADCTDTGIDGVILPDLPLEVFSEDSSSIWRENNTSTLHELFDAHDICNIFLITPQTPSARINRIDTLSNGFIYMVSSASTTGIRDHFATGQQDYFNRIAAMSLKNPRLIGFGISDSTGFATACRYAHGGIIGSAFVKMLGETRDWEKGIQEFVGRIRG